MSGWEESAPALRFVGPRDEPRAESDHAEGVLRTLGQRPRLDVVSAWRQGEPRFRERAEVARAARASLGCAVAS